MLSIQSSDMIIIKDWYHKFQECYNKYQHEFHDLSPDEASLEIIVADHKYINPTLNKIEELHKEYSNLKIIYKLGDKKE